MLCGYCCEVREDAPQNDVWKSRRLRLPLLACDTAGSHMTIPRNMNPPDMQSIASCRLEGSKDMKYCEMLSPSTGTDRADVA
jgi:hypothetical protein